MTSDKELKVLTKVARDILPYPVIGDRFITEDNAEDWAEEIINYHSIMARNLPDDSVEEDSMVSTKDLKVLMNILEDLSSPEYHNPELTHRVSELKYTLVSHFTNVDWGCNEDPYQTIPDGFIETVKRHAIVNLVDSTQGNPLDMALKVLESYHKDQLRNFEKSGEVIKILNKMERVIPLLLRAMEATDDLDLLEASIDLLEVHLAKLSELTK